MGYLSAASDLAGRAVNGVIGGAACGIMGESRASGEGRGKHMSKPVFTMHKTEFDYVEVQITEPRIDKFVIESMACWSDYQEELWYARKNLESASGKARQVYRDLESKLESGTNI